jgi:hypothetical protein
MINRDVTLTVKELLDAVNDGRVSLDTPIGVYSDRDEVVRGVCAFELHTHKNGERVFVLFNDLKNPPVAVDFPQTTTEIFP